MLHQTHYPFLVWSFTLLGVAVTKAESVVRVKPLLSDIVRRGSSLIPFQSSDLPMTIKRTRWIPVDEQRRIS